MYDIVVEIESQMKNHAQSILCELARASFSHKFMRNVCSLNYSLNALIWYYNISIKAELKHLNAIDIYWLYQECELLF